MAMDGPELVPCPCGGPRAYDACCGRIHRGERDAATAEELMRSRYSAFAVGDAAYLRRSWHPTTCPPEVRLGDGTVWLGLEVVATTAGDLFDAEGTVEFRAAHRRGGRDGVLHEVSRFVRLDGRWFYLGPAGTSPDLGVGGVGDVSGG